MTLAAKDDQVVYDSQKIDPLWLKVEPGYEPLACVLSYALAQAQSGKGKERHANSKPYMQQPIITEGRLLGMGSLIYQARKKALESIRLKEIRGKEAAQSELLGAINYLAATYLTLEDEREG